MGSINYDLTLRNVENEFGEFGRVGRFSNIERELFGAGQVAEGGFKFIVL